MGKKKKLKKKKKHTPSRKVHKKSHGISRESLFDDVLSYLFDVKPIEWSEQQIFDELADIIVETAFLIDEPEFQEIYFEPISAMNMVDEILDEKGLDHKKLDKMPEDASLAIWEDIQHACITRLYDDELHKKFVNSIEIFRKRNKRKKNKRHVAQAAAMLIILSEKKNREMVPTIGLLQEIFKRTLRIGMKFEEYSQQGKDDLNILSTEDVELNNYLKSAQNNLQIQSKLDGLMEAAWEEGMLAIQEGELYLGLFKYKELKAGLVQFFKGIPDEVKKKIQNGEEIDVDKVGTQQKIMETVEDQIKRMLNPKRMKKFRKTIKALLKQIDRDDKEIHLFLILVEDLLEDDLNSEDLFRFLVIVYISELKIVTQQSEELNNEHE